MLPSSIDIRAGGQFITDLLTHRIYRASPRPVGVIANRIQPNTETHEKLMNFLGCLDVPVVAQFRDSPVYTDAAEVGQGVVDMKDCRAARKETAAWKQLVNWIEENSPSNGQTVPIRMKPKSATRKVAQEEVGDSNLA